MSDLKRLAICILLLNVAMVWLPAHASAEEDGEVQRFALVIGANDGGDSRARLRHAVTDARNFARVLEELGGVQPDRMNVVEQPSPAGLEAHLDKVAEKLTAAQEESRRVEFVLYYSGHSDREGLLLGSGKVSYAKLRLSLDALPADVRLVVLDSCASGEVTRTKGGERRKPFLIDESSDVRGVAILASSSADESAQESDAIGASFFTHYLVSGLRGAADVNQDNLVTLNEAYQFTFRETLARTQTTKAGAQHAEYNMDLSGRGDLVLTDLRETAATLVFDTELAGRFYVKAVGRNLAVEVEKSRGEPLTIALPPGRYLVLRKHGAYSAAEASVAENQRERLSSSSFASIAAEEARRRGPAFAPAPETSEAPDNAWSKGQPVGLADRVNLRNGMDHFRIGLGIYSSPGNAVSGLAGDISYRKAISHDVDYLFPLMISGRVVENDHFTVTLDGGLSGFGFSSIGGVSTSATMLANAQFRANDHLGLTLTPEITGYHSWGNQQTSWSASSALTFDWTLGDRVQGGLGGEVEHLQNQYVVEPLNTSDSATLRRIDASFLRLGSVGGHWGGASPLLQVRIWKGLHLYEASTLNFDMDTMEVYNHRHTMGINWYF
ncbi:MAG: caspase family protein [Myxococcota bacterium]